jgi:hypothetical protein
MVEEKMEGKGGLAACSACYFTGSLIVNIKQGNNTLLTDTYKFFTDVKISRHIVIDYPQIAKRIIDGYALLESNNILCIYMVYEVEPVRDRSFIFYTDSPSKAVLSTDNGNSWAELEVDSGKAKGLAVDIGHLENIVKIERLANSPEHLKIFVSQYTDAGTKIHEIKFRKTGNKYEVE